jgi:hypothetical protein
MTAIVGGRLGKCPRCGKIHDFHEGQEEADCDCHLYCSEGSKPSDCNVSTTNFPDNLSGTLNLKWPLGVHDNNPNEGQDVMHRVRYCSIHDKYIMKVPILVKPMEGERYPRKYMWHRGET